MACPATGPQQRQTIDQATPTLRPPAEKRLQPKWRAQDARPRRLHHDHPSSFHRNHSRDGRRPARRLRRQGVSPLRARCLARCDTRTAAATCGNGCSSTGYRPSCCARACCRTSGRTGRRTSGRTSACRAARTGDRGHRAREPCRAGCPGTGLRGRRHQRRCKQVQDVCRGPSLRQLRAVCRQGRGRGWPVPHFCGPARERKGLVQRLLQEGGMTPLAGAA